jgi:septum site-determining protein MinC
MIEAVNNVTFKGTKEAIIIMIKEDVEMKELLLELEEKLIASVKFLKGVNYPIKVKGRRFTQEEFWQIAQKVKEIVGIDICPEDEEEIVKEQEVKKEKERKQKEPDLKSYFYGIDEGTTRFHRGTLRSGQMIKFHGNVVVIGDANPGSEIVASGNVIVLGLLRGIVHAGATGNKDSVVVAFNMSPTQLRIADVITRPPDGKIVVKTQAPEIAYIKDENIYIEYFLPNR